MSQLMGIITRLQSLQETAEAANEQCSVISK
ncbi:YkuJ protein [Bacillus subtilis]|nr:YkuJ protein [Bacillus subtilis]